MLILAKESLCDSQLWPSREDKKPPVRILENPKNNFETGYFCKKSNFEIILIFNENVKCVVGNRPASSARASEKSKFAKVHSIKKELRHKFGPFLGMHFKCSRPLDFLTTSRCMA
jgi:hypothetical protein